jgi:hypothetical protein
MKTLTTFLMVLALSAGLAAAQDVTGFKAPNQLGPSSESSKAPNMHPNLSPRLGGVFVDGAKYGTILISPSAPASYGVGEKYLSAPSSREDLMHESAQAAHHDAGGMKLFTLEF